MNGKDIGQLNVLARDDKNTESLLWSISGETGNDFII
jgi:hypothetical protein